MTTAAARGRRAAGAAAVAGPCCCVGGVVGWLVGMGWHGRRARAWRALLVELRLLHAAGRRAGHLAGRRAACAARQWAGPAGAADGAGGWASRRLARRAGCAVGQQRRSGRRGAGEARCAGRVARRRAASSAATWRPWRSSGCWRGSTWRGAARAGRACWPAWLVARLRRRLLAARDSTWSWRSTRAGPARCSAATSSSPACTPASPPGRCCPLGHPDRTPAPAARPGQADGGLLPPDAPTWPSASCCRSGIENLPRRDALLSCRALQLSAAGSG